MKKGKSVHALRAYWSGGADAWTGAVLTIATVPSVTRQALLANNSKCCYLSFNVFFVRVSMFWSGKKIIGVVVKYSRML